jgi:hypothetical protein
VLSRSLPTAAALDAPGEGNRMMLPVIMNYSAKFARFSWTFF